MSQSSNESGSPGNALASIEDIIAELRQGRMVVLVDAPDRENEGDLLIAAEHADAAAINFMITHGRGLVCLTLPGSHCDQLSLPLMTADNRSGFSTNFTVSIEAAEGVTTGISAYDRACTVQAAIDPDAGPDSIVSPGHIFPLRAHPWGVLGRDGHTEAGCDLARLAGLTPASVICEVLKPDGTMARLPDLLEFAERFGLKVGSIESLIEHRGRTESFIQRCGEQRLATPWGEVLALNYADQASGCHHLVLRSGSLDGCAAAHLAVFKEVSPLSFLAVDASQHGCSIGGVLSDAARCGQPAVVIVESLGGAQATLLPEGHGDLPPALSARDVALTAQILQDLGLETVEAVNQQAALQNLVRYGIGVG